MPSLSLYNSSDVLYEPLPSFAKASEWQESALIIFFVDRFRSLLVRICRIYLRSEIVELSKSPACRQSFLLALSLSKGLSRVVRQVYPESYRRTHHKLTDGLVLSLLKGLF